jgi:hypothetical protein
MATANEQRYAREQALYLLVLQGNNQAAITLYQNATGADGDNNPAVTRGYAQGFIAQLNQQGIGVSDSGIVPFGTAQVSYVGTGMVGTQSVAASSTPSSTDIAASVVAAVATVTGAGGAATGASTATPGVASPVQGITPGTIAIGVGAVTVAVILALWLGGHHKSRRTA